MTPIHITCYVCAEQLAMSVPSSFRHGLNVDNTQMPFYAYVCEYHHAQLVTFELEMIKVWEKL